MRKKLKDLFRNSSRREEGFTLVELLVYMAIFSILLVALSSIFGTILGVQLESKSTSSVDQDGRYILARLTHDMQTATAITTPSSGSLGVASPTLAITTSGGTYTYGLSGSDMTLTVGGVANNLNGYGTSISNLSFTRIGTGGTNDTVRVQFTVTSKTRKDGGAETATFQTTLGLQ